MRKPDLRKIDNLFSKGKDFTLTRNRYLSLTGADTPQDMYYTKNKSAIAKHAKSYGFEIEVIPEKLIFHKI